MANRRMFSLDVIDTDVFLEMPLTTQALYFQLGMRADDDGFVSSPKRVLKMLDCKPDDLRILISMGYVIVFETGVIVITDWKANNLIKTDRYKKTRYQEEFKQLELRDGTYVKKANDLPCENYSETVCIQGKNQVEPDWNPSGNILEPNWNQNGNQMEPQVRLGKDSIYNNTFTNVKVTSNLETMKKSHGTIPGQCPGHCPPEIELEKEIELNNKSPKGDYESKKSSDIFTQIQELYNSICKSYPRLTKISEKRKKAINARMKTGYTVEDFQRVFEKAESSDFLKGKNKRDWSATFDWLICDSNMAKVLDGNYDNVKGGGLNEQKDNVSVQLW